MDTIYSFSAIEMYVFIILFIFKWINHERKHKYNLFYLNKYLYRKYPIQHRLVYMESCIIILKLIIKRAYIVITHYVNLIKEEKGNHSQSGF